MSRRAVCIVAALLCGCVRAGSRPPVEGADVGPGRDVPAGGSVDVDVDAHAEAEIGSDTFGQGHWKLSNARPVAELNSSSYDGPVWLLADGLTVLFSSKRDGGKEKDVYRASRLGRLAPFGSIVPLAEINTDHREELTVTFDGMTAFLSTDRPGGEGGVDIWVAERPSIDKEWTSAMFEPEDAINTPGDDRDARPSADGLHLYFAPEDVSEDQNQNIVVASRSGRGAVFGSPQLLAGVNSSSSDFDAALSPDGRVLLFVSNRPGGSGGEDIWYAVRADEAGGGFTEPAPMPGLNTPENDGEPFISFDGTELYFVSERPGGQGSADIYRAMIIEAP